MKNNLNIYSNDNIKKILYPLLSKYDLVFKKLELIDYKAKKIQPNIIIINNENDEKLINFRKLNDNCLIISNLKKNTLDFNKNIKFLSTPISINHLKNTIEIFIQNLKIQFHDISIHGERLSNLTNNLFCYLTKVELEILTHLIREKKTTKDFIKENILNIKSNIETNSLDSHLTRIRKKMNKVDTRVKIKTKNEILLISV